MGPRPERAQQAGRERPVAPFQCCESYITCLPRALPWAGLFGPSGAFNHDGTGASPMLAVACLMVAGALGLPQPPPAAREIKVTVVAILASECEGPVDPRL